MRFRLICSMGFSAGIDQEMSFFDRCAYELMGLFRLVVGHFVLWGSTLIAASVGLRGYLGRRARLVSERLSCSAFVKGNVPCL